VEESITLSRTIRCAERLPGTTEESAALERQTSTAAESMLELGESAALGRSQASLHTAQVELQEGAVLERWMAANGDTGPLNADESTALHRSGSINLQSQSQLEEILSLSTSLLAAAEGLQEETEANENVSLARMGDLATTTGINASSDLTLEASISTATASSLNDIEAAISLTRYPGTTPTAEYSFSETITADICRTAEPASLAQVHDSVSLGALREGTWADRLLLNETLAMNGVRQDAFLGWTITDAVLLFLNCQNFSPTETVSAMPRPDIITLDIDLMTSRNFTSLLKTQAKFVTSITTTKPMEYER
jgi:hypothetical protein